MNARSVIQTDKEKRLRSLARRAGDLSVSAYHGGNREKAIHFQKRMQRILWPIWSGAQQDQTK